MTNKSTPGPWHFRHIDAIKESDHYYAGEFEIYGASGDVAHVFKLSDAQLFAAAKKLLAACETMIAWMEARGYQTVLQWPSGEVPCDEYEQLRAAIAQAKGAHNE